VEPVVPRTDIPINRAFFYADCLSSLIVNSLGSRFIRIIRIKENPSRRGGISVHAKHLEKWLSLTEKRAGFGNANKTKKLGFAKDGDIADYNLIA
jgi:hypothetical protein